MEPDTLRQLRGGAELAAKAVEAAVCAVAETHQAIMRQVYAPLEQLGPLAGPVHTVEQIQAAITAQVYLSILSINRVVSRGAITLLEQQRPRS
jgi:hypothetical protein